MGRPIKDLTGQKFGYLTVIKQEGKTKGGNAQWLCQCECGNTTKVASGNLVRGFISSCGCKREKTIGEKKRTHGESRSRLYLLWSRIKVRCNKSNFKFYKNYGGKGITYCKEWENFEPFRDWALANGYSDDLTIDRIDVNGNYEPNNCRWVTMKEQARNRTNNYVIYYKNKRYCATELAEEIGINVDTLKHKIARGMSIDEVINLLLANNKQDESEETNG